MDKHVIAIVVSVLLAFAVIVSITGILGKYIGNNTELICLGVVALVLLVILLIDKNKKE